MWGRLESARGRIARFDARRREGAAASADSGRLTVVDDTTHLCVTTRRRNLSVRSAADARHHCARLAFGNSFYAPATFHLQRLMMHSKYGGRSGASARQLTALIPCETRERRYIDRAAQPRRFKSSRRSRRVARLCIFAFDEIFRQKGKKKERIRDPLQRFVASSFDATGCYRSQTEN